MKTNFKRIGKQSISIVLAVMMMLSTMLVGTVTSNAVEIKADTVFYLDISNAIENFKDPNTIYMSVVGSENAKYESKADAVGPDAYSPQKDTWYQMTRTDNPNIYKVTVTKASSIGKVSFWNQNADKSNNVWEKSCSLGAIYDGTKNLFTLDENFTNVSDRNTNIYTGTWSTYGTEPTTKYNVTVDPKITNGTVTPSATSLAANEKFKVTATPDKDYMLGTVTVKDASGNPITADADGFYTMPASNVTVYATFKEKTDARFSVTYTDPTGSDGVVSATINPTEDELTAGLVAGAPVTVTVTVNEGYTASLDVDGKTVTPSISDNIYTFTFSMPAKDITVAPQVTKAGGNTDNEIQGLYLIYTTANDGNPTGFTEFLNLYYDSNNQVYAYFKDTELDTSKNYKFMISTLKGENSFEGTTNYNKDNYVNVTTTDSNSIDVGQNDYNVGSNKYIYGWFSVKNPSQSTVSSVKINLGYYNNGKIQESATDTSYTHSYEVIPISGVEGMVQVFAKDGTIRDGYQKYADMADTVLTAENADLSKYDNKNEYYESAYANPGTKLKITTTIGEGYREKYYVKAFSINGYSYGIIDASQAKKQNGVYTCEYTIPEDFDGKRIEITPIYYYIDDTDTVTFYVEGFEGEVQKMWGNTVAVHAWYANCEEEDDLNNSKFDSLTKNALGGYPGQPLVYQGGKYSMQIPKHLNGEKANYVKGITLNNYFWDNIHKQNFDDQSNTSKFNCQTYDYDDFYKLSESPDVDNIIFDFRYRTTDDNDKEGNIPNKKDLNSSTYDKSKLELLKDYSGNIVDIFGNVLSEDLTADYKNKHLTVISDGYVPITSIGNYATEWSVYDVDGTYITTINCSSLINESNVDADYTVAYNKLKGYDKLPVMIAYEKSITKGEQLGTRADGRWYFSKKAQKITANVKIEYKEDGSSEFKDDTFEPNSNVGKNTGAKAYFTNADYNGKTTCKGTVDGGNFSVHAETDANAKYYFLGWYLKTSDGYSFITNESDADFPMTNNETYVARFIPTPSGTLTLSHTLLTGSADGKTFIKADIVDSKGEVINSFEETSGNIVIPPSYVNYTNGYSIKVTLRTKPYGKDTVEGFYNSAKERYPDVEAGVNTCEKSTTITELFDPSTFELKKSNIPFYSKITSVPIPYQITYTYDTRLNDKQSYVIKDTVSGNELEQMWAENETAKLPNKEQLSKAFITRKAPFVSNFREEITWDMDHASINDYTAKVSSNTRTDKLNISALTVAGTTPGSWTNDEVAYGTLAMSNGDYLYKTGTENFPTTRKYKDATDAPTYEFSFWAIFDNLDAANNYSNEVATYMSGTPADNMKDRLTALTKLNGYDKLIAKSYSKEYNYISYQDYYIVPVYADRFAQNVINEAQTSIRLLEYTRNQWTDENGVKGDGTPNVGGTKTDYLYTDFALSFDKDQELIKNNANIKVGIAFEVVAKYDNVDFETYRTDSDINEIGSAVKKATKNGKVDSYTIDNASRDIYRYEINNSNISNKNRIEYYLRFKNTDNSKQNVLKVYSYIYDINNDKIYLSAPVYMNMYDIGTLTYIASDLASTNLQPAG